MCGGGLNLRQPSLGLCPYAPPPGAHGARWLFVSMPRVLWEQDYKVNLILNTIDAPASSSILLVPALGKSI